MTAPGLHLIFRLDQQEFALSSEFVREVILLPHVTPMEDAPEWVAGVIDVRGQMVPVIDLNIRLGRPPKPYRLTDAVIILQNNGTVMGLVVSEVKDVSFLGADQIRPLPFEPTAGTEQFASALATTSRGIATVLGAERLLQHSLKPLIVNRAPSVDPLPWESRFAEGDLPIFSSRAEVLRQTAESTKQGTALPVAVIRLNNEYYGVSLDVVREFLDQKRIVPIPGCPPHVVGLINLRGEVLGVADIRNLLSLADGADDENERQFKIMVVQDGEFRIGIIIHDVCQVLYLDPSEIQAETSGLVSDDRTYIQGAVRYGSGMMLMLNLKALIQSGVLDVNQEL